MAPVSHGRLAPRGYFAHASGPHPRRLFRPRLCRARRRLSDRLAFAPAPRRPDGRGRSRRPKDRRHPDRADPLGGGPTAVNDWFTGLMRDFGPVLVRSAGLVIVLLA